MKDVKEIELGDARFSGKTANNKELYIIVLTNNSSYFALRADEGAASVKISGYAIGDQIKLIKQLKKITSYNDALDLAKKENSELEFLTFPWHRITSIKAMKFIVTKKE